MLTLLLAQFKSPIILILVFATGLSFFLRDPVDACIIITIVLVSGLLGFWQERSATNAVEKLLAIVQIQAAVLRDGGPKDIPVAEIVPGDIVILNAGALVPGDCLVQESTDLFVDEAMLTGETFPVEKAVSVLSAETPLGQRTNVLWMGTHVVSGSAKALVIRTGKDTEFGKVSERLKLRPQETAFEHGIRQFGYFLMEVTLAFAWSPDGTLYVALAGTGGPNLPTEDAPAIEVFAGYFGGLSASVVRIEDGCPVVVADGLPSYVDGTGAVIGVSDVAFLDGRLYATVDGGGAVHGNPEHPVGLYRINEDGTAEVVADLSAWLRANPVAEPPAADFDTDGEVFQMLPAADGSSLWVVESNHGQVLQITPEGASRESPTCRRGTRCRPGSRRPRTAGSMSAP